MCKYIHLDICYLRLDFESFTTLGPADETEAGGGTCVDSFTVTVYNLDMLYLILPTLQPSLISRAAAV